VILIQRMGVTRYSSTLLVAMSYLPFGASTVAIWVVGANASDVGLRGE
jgi:hypothetical protein